jgi:hypothetical protein
MYTDPPAPRPYHSLHEFSFEDFKLPFAIAPPNEDLVTGGDVVLAFDRVVKQEGREFLTSSWRSDQAVCLRERAVYIDCPGRLNAKPLNQVVWCCLELECRGKSGMCGLTTVL